MKETRIIMGMPVEIEVVGGSDAVRAALEDAFAHLAAVDRRFSTYKDDSEISRLNRGEFGREEASAEMREVFDLAEKTRQETAGYFDIRHPSGRLDPSGIVKGWAVRNAAKRIRDAGHEHYMVNAGGDIALGGKNAEGGEWGIGIRNPFKTNEIVKVVYPRGKGIATSGSYIRGSHIYNPHAPEKPLDDIVSITVVGPDVLEADRFATAAFAMGRKGVDFIESLPGFEAYMIDKNGTATMTSGWKTYANG